MTSAESAAPAIAFDGVAFRRGARVILDGFDLEIPPGEVLALVGRSGAGKSTVLKLVNRMLVPDAGTVRVSGRDTAAWNPYDLRRRIGYVLQEIALFPHLSVADNVALVPQLLGWEAQRTRARVDELLDLCGLGDAGIARRRPHELSGGQRQRVGVARALAADPPILLMDEPFGALDPMTRGDLHRQFQSIQQRLHKTVLIVTHDMGEAFALASRIGVLDAGRLAAIDRPAAIAQSEDPRVRGLLQPLLDATAALQGTPR